MCLGLELWLLDCFSLFCRWLRYLFLFWHFFLLWSDLIFHGLLFSLFLFLLKVKYGHVVVISKGSVPIIKEFSFELYRLFLNFILFFFLSDFLRLLFFFFLCNLFYDILFDLFRH